MNSNFSEDLRVSLSFQLSRFFLRHLEEELTKPRRLLTHITFEGIPFEELTRGMIDNLKMDFPGLENLAPVPYNFFERWWGSLDMSIPYNKTTFKLWNQGMLARLSELKDGTIESYRNLKNIYMTNLENARIRGHRLSYETTLTGEARMYDYMRRIVLDSDELPNEECFELLLKQQQMIGRFGFDFFESHLKSSLQRSDAVLQTLLPAPIAEELKETGKVIPRKISDASIMFADIVGFTGISERLPPEELLSELDRCFSHFDAIMHKFRLEKIKTIGDSYMCAGGVITPNNTHAIDAVLCALQIQEFMRKYKKSRNRIGEEAWELRVGIHTGPVIAGIIGSQRFSFDVWGDSVNTASRMESAGEPGGINISRETFERVKDFFDLEYRGKLPAKNKGDIDMYYVKNIKSRYSVKGNGKVVNRRFKIAYVRRRRAG